MIGAICRNEAQHDLCKIFLPETLGLPAITMASASGNFHKISIAIIDSDATRVQKLTIKKMTADQHHK